MRFYALLEKAPKISLEKVRKRSNLNSENVINTIMSVTYQNYINYVNDVCNSGDLSTFKRHPDYNWVLEHTSQQAGFQYLHFIKTLTSISEDAMIRFCKLNDSVGSPETANFGFVTASPSNFRYIFHAHLILSYLQTLNLPTTNIIEVGGGYGGLCLAIHFFAEHYKVKVSSYKIVDLEAVTRLDMLYLSKVNPSLSVECIDSATFGKNIQVEDGFLISNYCFSELPLELRQRYMRHLFGKISHGFMAWNCIPLYDFGFSYKEESEYPLTGAFNKYVYF